MYTKELKDEILSKYDNGSRISDLSRELNIPTSTIASWISRRNDNNIGSLIKVDAVSIKELVSTITFTIGSTKIEMDSSNLIKFIQVIK
jgi:transposase-like protein